MTEDRFHSPLPEHHRKRLRQLFRYLVGHFPPSRSTSLVIRRIAPKHDATALCDEDGRGGLVVVLDARHSFYSAVDSLLHEYAHAMTWDTEPPHGPAWAGSYAALVAAFEDGDAWTDSQAW